MKLKQFIFALVAMLSFAFSAFAQSTKVSTEADLQAALNGGGEVTLDASITVSAPVTIPSGSEVVLNLNGKTLKATNAKTKVLENSGKLTINGQGTVSGIIYNGTANGSTAEMILNGGTYNLDGNSGGLHHYGKTLTINDGVVVKTTSYGVRVQSKNSVLNLYGGTFTATTAGDMCRPFAISKGTVNFLDKDITVNGYMHVMVGECTINFGDNNENSPFEAYHQGNSYASSVFYCKTLAEAISRTDFAAVTLVKNVKVAADAPITVNKEINLNLNGKNLSATNAKTTVLKNYANLTIKGKGTVTGLVYNGDADNKGVAEMTLNGGTYKLDGANGGIFNYGKTLTVNDGVTISSQVYGLRMSNATSVINLNGGTFTSTNPTDNMKRAIAVDAGTINFNDDDITINGYLHANRTKAKVNFGEYCPFDAFMCSTTNASGYYVVNLENAIDKADAGYEIVLQKNLERSEIVTLPKKLTLDGNGKTLTSTAGRAINVDCADVVTIENLTIAGATGCERGINIINKAGTTNIKKVNVSGVSHYAVHVATSAGAAQVNIENSNLTGWAAVAAYGEGGTVNVKNSNLVGVNNYTGNSDDFATVAAGSNIAINVTGGKVTAESFEGKAAQAIVCAQSSVKNAKFTLDAELELKGTAEYVNIDLDNNTVAVREAYGTNFVTTPAVNGLVTLTGASEAMIGNVKYSTIAQAFAAAKEDETITLIADVTPSLTSQRAITKAAVIDLNGKTMTLTEDDLYFGTTTFKNGIIVVDPSVKASTAVFWMFENQTLTFDNVDIVATGVTGTYLIGINGGTGTAVNLLNGSSITINNDATTALTAVICDNGTGNTVTIKDSEIDVKNIEGRFYLGGKNGVAVVENTNVDLNGVKEGFYLRAGQSLDIAGTTTVDITLNTDEGRYGINVTDATAKYNKASDATVNATVFIPTVAMIGTQSYASLEDAVAAAQAGDVITMYLDVTLAESLTLPAGITFNGNGKQINGAITAGGDLTFAGHTKVTNFSAGYYNRVITIGEGACLEVTGGRMTVSYGNTFNITGSVTNAKEADKANIKPSLIVEPGLSFNGDGRGVEFNVTNAYVKLGDSSSKNNGATGEFNFNFNNSIVEFTKTLKTYEPTVSGLAPEFEFNAVNSVVTFASHLELWRTNNNFVLNNTDLTVGGSFANAGGITVENGANFVVNAPIMSSHGGNTGTINVLGGTFELKDSNQDWENAGTMKVAVNGKIITNDFKCVGEGKILVDATDIPENTDVKVVDGNGVYNFQNVTTVEGPVVATSFADGDVVIFKTYAKIGDTYYKSLKAAIDAVQNGETIEMVDDCSEVVNINKSNVAFTIDGAQKTYTGKIEINIGQNVVVKNLNFVHEADEATDFIANVGSPTGKNYNTTLLVDGCSFTGNGKDNVVAVRTIHPTLVTIQNSNGKGLHSMLQNTGGQVVVVDGVTVTESNGGLAIGSPNGQVTVKNSNLTTATYGVRLDANNTNAPGAILENNKINAYIPVSVRKASATKYKLTFNGNESAYTATNNDGKWCAICTTEYEQGVALNEPTGKIKVVVNANLPQSGLYGNYIAGSLTAVYSSETGYFGECGGNANYSFEFKFFNDNTYMGSTSLNDVDNIIDGDVYVTWHIDFNADANQDNYWKMSWDVAPSVTMQPNRVEQWVDGVKVAECAIQLNGPDNLYPITTAVVDESGKIVKCYPTLEAAVAAGNNVAILKAGKYALKVKDGLTITGAVEGVEFANIGAFGCNGANVTFNNVTFTYASNSTYKGLQHSGNLVYNNCTFNGQVFLYGQSETFNKCTFNTTDAANYNVWTYGAKNVAFNECTFNSAGKSVLIYAESASVFNNVTVEGCTFKASAPVEGKAAIELDSSLTSGANLTITNSTAEGFGTGNVSGNSLWNNKKGNANAANNDITIVVDGNSVLAPVYDAKIGGAQYRSLQEAIDAVQEGETITMLADVEFVNVASAADKTTSINVPAGKKFTLDLNGKTIYGENSSNSSFAFMTICSGADVTIDDTSAEKTGKIAYKSTRETPNENHEGYTIRNKGNLTLNGGTVANSTPLASNGYEMAVTTAIDNCSSSGAVSTFTMNGGVVVSNTYFAIRSNVYANNTNGATSAIVALNGGTVHGLHFCDWGSKNLDYQVAIAADAVIEHGNYPDFTDQALRLAIGANTSKVAIDIAEEAQINGTIHGAAAKIGTLYYTKLQKAIDAVKNGETITLIADNKENVTVVQAPDMAFTIDGNDKTMKGTITVNGKSAAYATAGLTIKNVNFVADGIAAEACINLGVKGDNNTRYTSNVTVDGCTFTGADKAKAGIKNYTGGCKNVTISNCTATGLHSLAQFKTSYGVTLTKNTVTECKNGISVDGSTGVTVTECTVDVAGYGIRANGGSDVTVTSNNVKAFTPVVVRNVTANSNFAFNGANTMTANDETGKWMVIGDEEYEAGNTLPAESTANVVVALNDANLSYTDIHGAGLAGAGTEEAPYLINNVVELQMFRDKVNGGATKFNASGVWVALAADINLADINWVGIGSMNADHGFMGNFDGKGFKIQNLTIKDPALDNDGYAYAGLFALTEGTDKDNQNVVKNLTIENVTIKTDGHIAAAAIAYAYYTNVDNVKVCGNIAIEGGDYTAGVLAYTRRCVNASNLAVEGNDGSYIKGAKTVGGVISDIQMNGGLKAEYSNFSAQGVTVSGKKNVGGISGIIATQTLNGASVKNITLNSEDARVGIVAGALGGTSTISNVTYESVTGATALLGATFDEAKTVEARIGDTYYATFAAAYTAAQAGETVTMLADLNMSEILVINKAITLDGDGKTLTSTAGRAINVDCEGNVGIKNLTINASGERAINVIQKPAKVTIDNVTATAANYTVNLAGSAANAVVTINESNLTGLNVVNVAAAGAQVTVDNTTLNCADNSEAEGYAALVLNKDAKNGSIVATDVTFNIDGDSRKASNQAEGGIITIDGSADEVEQHVAYISYGNNWYGFATLEAAIAKANAGETVTLLRDVKASAIITIDKAITLDGNGKTLTSTAGRAINVSGANGVTIKGLTIDAKGERAINVIQNATNVTIDGVTAIAANYTVNVAASAPNAVVAIKNSTLNGLCTVNVSAAGVKVTVDNSTVNCNDNNTTEGEAYAALCLNKEAVGGSIVATNSTINVTEGSDSMKGRNGAEDGTVTINGSTDGVAVMVAVITYEGSVYYHSFSSLAKAVEFAKAGDVVTLIRDVTVAQPVVINKSVTLDGNGKTLTYTGADRAIEMPNVADANYDVTIKNLNVVATTANRGLNYNDNGKLNVEGVTVTIGENVDGYAINFPGMADNAQVTIKDSKLTSRNPLNIWGENMTINVHNSEIISVDNSTTYDYAAIQLNNDLYGNVANGTTVNVYGGTITALNDKGQPSNVVANATETGVVNISNETVVTGKVLDYVANIGGVYFGSLQAAVNAIEKYGYNSPIVLMKSFSTSEATTIKSGLNVTINLNGKTITGTDNGTASFGLITNKGNLTINGEGAITLVATNDRDWNAYSSVISNTVGGKLTVNGGTIEHLGGTDMAYAIDNLTNGKGTYAETIINGGAVKSTYRAVRQFLNGTEAQNILTVNGGTIEGTNKSIWMQDPSKNANTGNLTVAADAKLTGDVYLSVTAGSTEWPVEVAVAAAALQGESKVLTSNVPAGYDLALVNGAYGVYTGVAKIGTAYYDTLKDAVAAAQAGETITLIDNVEASEVILLGKSLTINGNGYKVTSNATRVFRVTTSDTKVTLNDVNMVSRTVMVYPNDIRGISIDASLQNVELTLNNCSVDFTDATACDWAYAVNVSGNGTGHTVTVNGGAYEGANVINVHGANNTVTVKDATLTSLYPNNDAYMGACIWVLQNQNTSVEATGNTFNGDNAYAFNLGNGNPLTESDNIDNTKYVLAKIGDAYYTSIQDAIDAAQDGETVRLIQNVKMDTKTLATQNDGYAVLVNVNGKKVTIDLNGKKITVNAAAADLAAAKGKMLLTVFHADTNGELTLTDNTADKAGAVVVNVNDATVYSVFASESQYSDKSESGKLTVNAGNYTTVGKIANAMFFTDANEVITVNGGNFHCDGATTTASNPWMFNTLGNNELHVTVNGGTFNVDVNHQHRPFEVKVPETLAVKANDNGTWTVVEAEAYITEMLGGTVHEAGEWGHKVGYATIAEAIAAVNELGNKVSIAKDLELTEAVVVPADKTVVLDLNGKAVTMNDASGATAVLLKNNGNLTIMDGTEAKAGKLSFKTTTPSAANAYASNTISNYGTLTIESGNVENLSVGGGACYVLDNYAGSTATINGGKLTAEKTAVRIFNWTNGEEAKATINMNGGEIYSKNGYGINVNSGNAPFVALNIAGGTITTDYADYKLAVYVVNKGTAENFTANVTGGTFNGIFALNGVTAQTMKQDAVAVSGGTFEGVTCYEDPAYGFVSSGTFKSVVDAKAVATGYICKDNGDGTFGVIVDPKHGMVAQIIRDDYYAENQYFATINEAVQAAVSGETVTLIADVETSAAKLATVGKENYAVLVAVKEKDITLNLNGKSVTVTPTSEELANAAGEMLMSVFGMDTNGKLTLTGNGSVKVNANGANVYSLVAAYGEGSAVVIENGNYEADKVMSSGSLIYSHEMITVMDGTFNLGNIATGANGSPWIFNTIGQNYTGVKVVGGTYPTDINHQFWANEVLVPEAYALKNNGDGTWTVVDAVAYTNEKATSRGASWRHVGYASLEDAIAATGKYNCQNNTVTMIKDITLEPITVANDVKVAIDLNGKTISGTDNGTASFGLITNKGDLTINGTGAITLTATQNRGWSAYSSVISNTVGGKLTVNGGTIEHLGGTSMAYAIDNLTNGKGTYAETEINGGEIKSTYRPIRMFLNGVEAENILTVNAGTIESTGNNKAAIWMQTAGDYAHSGTLYVGADAVIKNNVYLDADNLKNVREYPVEAYIAKAALAEGMTVLADAIPAEAAALVEYETFWQVEQKNLAELTIEDDCEEYINKIEKNVGVLTYERYFYDTEWQTIVLPFDVPVANLMDQFEVAYIYNASYMDKKATIQYVVIEDSEFVLAANYPYMIRAKEAGWNDIVVENAKLMPTEAETLDCSSIFEKFSFIGNYATVDAVNLDPTMGYFSLNGAWSKMETINPFRFYMQIKLRNGAAFEYPTDPQAIRMRSVNANGEETTGINGVDAEQAGDFIFDLHGRRVLETEKGGIYIKNGQKFIAQ